MKKKTVYSVWFRSILKAQKEASARREQIRISEDEKKRLALEEENRLKNIKRERLEKENIELRKKHSTLIQEGMQKDFRLDKDNLDLFYVADKEKEKDEDRLLYEAESFYDKKRREKEQKQIQKIKNRQARLEEKEYRKALAMKAKSEGLAKKGEDEIAEEDVQVRINNERNYANLQRKWAKEEREVLNERERNKTKELDLQLKREALIKKKTNKALQEEFEKQEHLRKEQELAEKKIRAKRMKASGWTFTRRIETKIRRFLRIYSFTNLKNTINTYGYSYTFGEFVGQTVAIVSGVTLISWYSKLTNWRFFGVVAVAFISIPFLLYAWFNQMFVGKKFEMVQSYLSNIIPVFMQKPKIRYALQEVRDMSRGQMKEAIQHAIDYIDTASDDEELTKTALSFIEAEFPNSRIRAVHKMLLDIENGNSKDYTLICENMYTDVEAWIRRVYNFQKELKNRRNSLVILCGFSLILNSIFISVYNSNEIFNGFTDRMLYQIATALFIVAVLVTAALILTKLHGDWLIYDAGEKSDIENIRAYSYIQINENACAKSDIITGLILIIIGIILWAGFKNTAAVVLIPFALLYIFKGKTKYKSRFNRVKKALMLEFPVWLRTVALSLHDMTVVNAIRESSNTASYCMQKEIEKFFAIYDANPTSIRAFNEFLSEYEIEDVQASMKVLFTMQSMSNEEIQRQIAMIIDRNQELLNKTETIRNQDSLGYAEMLGYAPMVLLTTQMIMSMLLMFIHIVDYMNTVLSSNLGGF